MFPLSSTRVVVALAALASVVSTTSIADKRQVTLTCPSDTGTATCCYEFVDPASVSDILSLAGIYSTSLTGEVGLFCGPDIDSGCGSIEQAACCTGGVTLPVIGESIATGCTNVSA
ncbi:uncharacterized protein STEHIDRAFT_158666 [Stereum hirsutum FP-91666 SS1]|uniref:uncharacterized protein n=1 Tax=Stereum hirsutum (strain FP-91666) TaxID=721885 RepID=UPI0004449F86|nr:uncharacterized protein STEHIDRAFT_158666 [Stereum hirsutum FP-91666 SS1]EIM84963.1 hypothetical protein STEHIDRAFT_158666 [Stereum hirsutum FP-91666 SS1]